MLSRHETPVLIVLCLILLVLIWASCRPSDADDNPAPVPLVDAAETVPELAPQKVTVPEPLVAVALVAAGGAA